MKRLTLALLLILALLLAACYPYCPRTPRGYERCYFPQSIAATR